MWWDRKSVIALFLIAVAVNVAAVVWYRSARKLPFVPEATQAAPQQQQDITDFIQTHRERTRALIQELRSESTNEMVEKLSDDSHVRYPGILTGLDDAQLCWQHVLSNRRAIRLLSIYREIDPEARVRQVAQAFDQTFKTHQDAIERVIASYENPANPKNNQSLTGSRIGVCCGLFLTAECDRKQLTERIARTRQWAEAVRQQLKLKPQLPEMAHFVIARFLEPDNAFYVSLIMHITPKDQQEATLKDHGLDQMGILMPIELTAWDAEPGTFDLVRQRQLHPGNPGDLTEQFQNFAWNGLYHLNLKAQSKAVESLLSGVAPKDPKP
jgi:hypothetical protein